MKATTKSLLLPNMELIHEASWSTYEEDGCIEIYQNGYKYFYREGISSVMGGYDEPYFGGSNCL